MISLSCCSMSLVSPCPLLAYSLYLTMVFEENYLGLRLCRPHRVWDIFMTTTEKPYSELRWNPVIKGLYKLLDGAQFFEERFMLFYSQAYFSVCVFCII